MSFLLKAAFIFTLFFSFVFASWYVVHGDIEFTADIGRGFQLLREVDQKKLILIGPRSSGNLYHGPLWLYVNYPAYVLGGGDPIAVGWNWVLLWAIFTTFCFFVGRRLFDLRTAFVFTMLSGLFGAFSVHGMNNPHGALVCMPLLIYFFVRYIEKKKAFFLVYYFLVLGAVTHFEIALGIPFILLSIPPLVFIAFRYKRKKHLLAFGVLFLTLSNFSIFDLRHNFLISQSAVRFASPQVGSQMFNYLQYFQERISLTFTGVQFLRQDVGHANFWLFLAMLAAIYFQIRDKKYKTFYISVLYFYFGFFILSFIDKGPLLYWYLYPMFPLLFLAAASLMTSRFARVFFVIFFVILVLNVRTALSDIQVSEAFIGKSLYSWKFLNGMSQKVFQGKEKELGYFVYAPDAFAYEGKYALYYASKRSDKVSSYFVKKPVTYLVLQPPPPDNPHMKSDWWIKNQVKIDASPTAVFDFPNGYQVMQFHLTDAQTKVPFDASLDPGITFR